MPTITDRRFHPLQHINTLPYMVVESSVFFACVTSCCPCRTEQYLRYDPNLTPNHT